MLLRQTLLIAGIWSATATAQDVRPTLVGGTPANIQDFPASVYISMGGGRCTATVVGPQTVITAAHCVSDGSSISFSVGANRYTGRCSIHSAYNGNATADWALCKTNNIVSGIAYERLNTAPERLTVGKTIQMTGYGCTGRSGSGTGGNDGTYRIGDSIITGIPSGSDYDITVRGNNVSLCPGDSGGPAFLYLDAAKKDRVLISVNSRVSINGSSLGDESYLSSIAAPTVISWAQQWATTNSVKICGVHSDATGCRAAPSNPTTPECTTMISARSSDTWQSCLTSDSKPAKASCETALQQMGRCYRSRYP